MLAVIHDFENCEIAGPKRQMRLQVMKQGQVIAELFTDARGDDKDLSFRWSVAEWWALWQPQADEVRIDDVE